jgi:hypothetical protein
MENTQDGKIFTNEYARKSDGARTTSFGPNGSDQHVDKPNGHLVVTNGQIEHLRLDDGGGADGKGTVIVNNGEVVKPK